MGRSTLNNVTAVLNYYWNRASQGIETLHDIKNNTPLSAADPTDTTSVHMISVDTDSRVRVDRAAEYGAREPIQFYINANATLANQAFFIADRPMVITAIEYQHATAGTDGSAVTAVITHDSGTQAAGAGTTVQTNTFNCKGTASVTQAATLLAVDGNGNPNTGITLAAGDRLSIVFAGTLTTLAGVVVTVFAAPGFKEVPVVYSMLANSTIATQSIFVANRSYTVAGVSMIWGTAATDVGAVTLTITKESSTTAPGGGTAILAAAQSVKGAINTVVNPALSATASALNLAPGDRLSLKTAGTLTALAGVVVVVYLAPLGAYGYIGQMDETFTLNANGALATQGLFLADRTYEVVDVSGVWATAGTDGSAVTIDVTNDPSGTAPGGGSSVLAGTMNAKATASTVVLPGVNTQRRQRLIAQGSLLSVKFTGTLTALAGVTVTASLRPV